MSCATQNIRSWGLYRIFKLAIRGLRSCQDSFRFETYRTATCARRPSADAYDRLRPFKPMASQTATEADCLVNRLDKAIAEVNPSRSPNTIQPLAALDGIEPTIWQRQAAEWDFPSEQASEIGSRTHPLARTWFPASGHRWVVGVALRTLDVPGRRRAIGQPQPVL